MTGALAETAGTENIAAVPGTGSTNEIIWNPSGETGLRLGEPGLVVVVNDTTTESIGSGLNLSFCSVAWRPDGSYALIIGQRGTILRFADMRSGLIPIESHTRVDLTEVSWKPDGSYAIITGIDGVMLRFNHDTQTCLQIETHAIGPLGGISWDNTGQHAQIHTEDGNTITYPPSTEGSIHEVAIQEPAAGSTISGICHVRGTAFVGSDVLSKVEWCLDFGSWGPAAGTDIWEFSLDTSSFPNGHHSISVRASSSAGEETTATAWITIENVLLPPMIGISSPRDGAALSGTVIFSGTATGWYGPIERVDFRIDDDVWELAIGTGVWKRTIDTTTLPNGVHRLKARAWDGNSFSAVSCIFTVGNEHPVSNHASPSTSEQQQTGTWTDIDSTQGEQPGGSVPPEQATPQDQGTMPAQIPAPLDRTSDGGTISVPMASWGLLLLAALALATEHGKFALFQFIFVPLYSRIRKDRVLDNFTRGMIYGFIMSNPGVHYNFIKQKLGLNNGSIVYHLTVLERQELIKSEKVGLYKRFYPRNGSLSESGIMELSDSQEKLLELVKGNPGLTQREIADRMGLSGRIVNYHVGLLQRSRLLTLEKVGKHTRCYATERMPVC